MVERFREIVVAPGVQALDDVPRVGPRGHQDDRDEGKARVALERANGRDSVEAWHHHVEENEIGQERAGPLETFDAVGRRLDRIALRFEPQAQDLEILGRVVHREDEGRVAQDRNPFRPRARAPWRAAVAG
jgi:hypothetical protein